MPISNPKQDLHNTDTDTKFGENSWIFTQVNLLSGMKCRWTYDRGMDTLTIILCHYCVHKYSLTHTGIYLICML